MSNPSKKKLLKFRKKDKRKDKKRALLAKQMREELFRKVS